MSRRIHVCERAARAGAKGPKSYVFGEPGPPGALRSQGSEQDGACRAVSSGAAVR